MLAVFSGYEKFLKSNYRVKNILHLHEKIEEAKVKTHSQPGNG